MNEFSKWIISLILTVLTGVTAYQFKRIDDLEGRQYAQALEVGRVYTTKIELKEAIESSNMRTDERVESLALLIDTKTKHILMAIHKIGENGNKR
ncbi:hypothetical protein [Vibrio harveyi]|uniref:hypothetical protein n=1 Tax=Vibrio harveyi TaxID=669 RepID=UPI000A941A62|nr:hypothetical protein [Vibrio harveyi]MBY7699346.1 hypothetical protein [Vibrio harveyi]UIL56481.1 hypothetical protein LXG94_02280 [Vibrio harveyi]SQA36261.1 Uncharacterised protein [Vibrio harveyi]